MNVENMKPITEANAWIGATLPDRESLAYEWTSKMINEIADAARAAKGRGLGDQQIRRGNFEIPKASALMAEVYADLEDGHGFAVVAGWPVDDFSYEENVTAFCGVAAHLGEIVVQNHEGHAVVDIRDEGMPYSHLSRGYRSNKHLPFHTDGSDLVGLLCLGEAASGGESLLVSVTQVFNVILEEKPEILEILERGFYHHRRGQHGAGENPLSEHRIPVFSFTDGYLHSCYNRNPIDWVEKEGVTLAAEEKAALDYLDSIIERPEMALETGLRKGDMQFLNNFVIFHSRTAYEDRGTRRHLVRLWLENPNSKRMGESLLDLYVPGTSRYHASKASAGS